MYNVMSSIGAAAKTSDKTSSSSQGLVLTSLVNVHQVL